VVTIRDGVEDRLFRQRRQPAHVDDARLDAVRLDQGLDRLVREIAAIAVGQDRQMVAMAVHADLAEADAPVGRRVVAHPQPVLFAMQVAHRIKRDRLDEDTDALFLARQPHAFAQHHRRVGAIRRTGENMPGMSRSTASELSLWKCPPKPFW
jgi:hypothetical protein